MNAKIHADISFKRWGGETQEDFDLFYKIHDFMDCSKEVEPTNRHRCLTHTLWFVKRALIPIFGHTLKLSNGKEISLKDDMEFSHIIPDFGGKYFPTISDFVGAIRDDSSDGDRFAEFYKDNELIFKQPEIENLMMSPLFATGKLKSLLISHNSWFVGQILPLIFKDFVPEIKNYSINPSDLFGRMQYADWMSGKNPPPSEPPKKTTFISFEEILNKPEAEVEKPTWPEPPRPEVYDGYPGVGDLFRKIRD